MENYQKSVRNIILQLLEDYENDIDKTAEALIDMLSAIHEFITYGKVRGLKTYYDEKRLQESGDKKKHIEEVLKSVEEISESIQFAAPDLFQKRVCRLKEVLRDYKKTGHVFDIFVNAIERDYGELLGDWGETPPVVTIVEWCLKREFYQQALAFIESKMPSAYVDDKLLYYTISSDKIEKVRAEYIRDYSKNVRYQTEDEKHFYINYYQDKVENDFFKGEKKRRYFVENRAMGYEELIKIIDYDDNEEFKETFHAAGEYKKSKILSQKSYAGAYKSYCQKIGNQKFEKKMQHFFKSYEILNLRRFVTVAKYAGTFLRSGFDFHTQLSDVEPLEQSILVYLMLRDERQYAMRAKVKEEHLGLDRLVKIMQAYIMNYKKLVQNKKNNSHNQLIDKQGDHDDTKNETGR